MVRRLTLVAVVLTAAVAAFGCASSADAPAVGTGGPDTTTTTAASSEPVDLLTPADVEAVSGLTGLEVVKYDPATGAGGDVNIATAEGQLVVMLVVEGPETWDAWLTDGYTVAEPVTPPVGDESFVGPNPDTSPSTYIFGFRKGESAVVIDTYFDANGETILSVEQLRSLAEVVAGRL